MKQFLILGLFLSLSMFVTAQEMRVIECPGCDNSDNAIIYVDNGACYATFTAATAQAYYWEICDGFGEITGSSYADTVTANCIDCSGYVIKLTRFINGQCVESCREWQCQ